MGERFGRDVDVNSMYIYVVICLHIAFITHFYDQIRGLICKLLHVREKCIKMGFNST